MRHPALPNSPLQPLVVLAFLCLPLQAVEPLFPPAIKPGDTIQFVAPAGPLNAEKMKLAQSRLEAMGFKIKPNGNLFRKTGYLAGSDEERAAELNRAFADPEVDAIFPGTGGYGTMRILEKLDYETIRENPKVMISFSDITALHIAINQRTGLVTFHSPTPMWGLGVKSNLTPFSAHYFWRAILANRYSPGQTGYDISAAGWSDSAKTELADVCKLEPPITVCGGKATGRLIGGNLSPGVGSLWNRLSA